MTRCTRNWILIVLQLTFVVNVYSQSADWYNQINRKCVKIFGAGGLGRIEAYGTGFFINDKGAILTNLSPILETEELQVVLFDGQKIKASVMGVDTQLKIAVLQIDYEGNSYFKLDSPETKPVGSTVFAVSNLFQIASDAEWMSFQKGVIAAFGTIDARQGFQEYSIDQPVYIVDSNICNPGSPGGPLVDREGNLIGMIGKELKNNLTNTWVNFALPNQMLLAFIQGNRSNESTGKDKEKNNVKIVQHLRSLPDVCGIRFLPDVLDQLPPFVESVRIDSEAAQSGIQSDDLVAFVNDRLVHSVDELLEEIVRSIIGNNDSIQLSVLRDDKLINLELKIDEQTKTTVNELSKTQNSDSSNR